ncbi:Tll0287-like domain-containing protein [Pseudoxanthomonas koreensis]|uniref:Tll0287-like domain-containing protein n=1 Tax=Pseudoxanthomonas koreensis TaxID=266061 RepID=UPI0013917270|nr:DUF3365 domain-containing protein [Pseudoxanthomonas koreensis]KAF1695273.1 hypothetical protein CSC64_03215 [Pseudoxanthomonas koreensis]
MNPTPFRFTALAACLAIATTAGCARLPAAAATASDAGTPTPAAPVAADNDAGLARASAAAMAFSSQLRSELLAAMAAGGPVAAVDVCHTRAPRIAGMVMTEHGVQLGRVALPGRNRNPAQAADDWRLATLQVFQQAVDAGAPAAEQVSVVRDGLPDGVALRMMRGIATEPACLACHGSEVAGPVRAAIAKRYPGDQATGFAVGDLRGALWVEVPTPAAPGPAAP